MTKITGYTQPPLDRALEHHGVLGMKWGHRKAQDGGGSGGSSSSKPPKPPKPTTADIKSARLRQEARINQINSLGDQHVLATTDKGRREIERQIGKLTEGLVSDSQLANRSTKGEKWLTGIGIGLLAVSVGAKIAVGAAANRR